MFFLECNGTTRFMAIILIINCTPYEHNETAAYNFKTQVAYSFSSRTHNARAEIFYRQDSKDHIILGGDPIRTEDWYNATVTVMLPETTTAIKTMIHGTTANFTARIDHTSIDIQ